VQISLEKIDATTDNLDKAPSHLMFTEMDHVIQMRDDVRKFWRTAQPNVDLEDSGELAFRQFIARTNHLLGGLTVQSMQPHS
jgi:hypothetical protein